MTGVAPNVDTLYSVAWIDLAEEPFVLEAPDFGSRYYTFQFGLADTATESSLGARTHGSRLPAIVVTGPGEHAPVPPDLLHVASTTRYLLIAGRILVRPDDPDDFAAVYDRQSRIKLRPLSRYRAGEEGPNPVPEQRRLDDGADIVANDLTTLVELGNLLRDWVVEPVRARLDRVVQNDRRDVRPGLQPPLRWTLPRRPPSLAGSPRDERSSRERRTTWVVTRTVGRSTTAARVSETTTSCERRSRRIWCT